MRQFWLGILFGGFLLYSCTPEQPVTDDDTGPSDDDDTTYGDDDDVAPGDVCDDYPGEIICQGDMAITCDVAGDVAGTQECDTASGEYCFPDMGCINCYPGQVWCDGFDVVECSGDGLTSVVVETCDEQAGFVCEGGSCVSLCQQAEEARSSIGCRFYGIDMEQYYLYIELPYAIVVSNVHETLSAHVDVETINGGVWSPYTSVDVAPQDLAEINLPNSQITGTGLAEGNAYRVTSNIPVIAYQFNPLDGVNSHTSDASLLLPASAFDVAYIVPTWGGSSNGDSQVVVVAEQDGTTVVVTPSVATAAGGVVSAGSAGVAMPPITLDEGDVLQIAAASTTTSMEGTRVEASNRVAVFAGHSCANIPASNTACDHVEEQVFGLQTWGTTYVGTRLPARANPPEMSVWHFTAGDDPTTLSFVADPVVTGLPPGNAITLAAGESTELQITGDASFTGDFLVTGTEAFIATQYMIGESQGGGIGDPCMIQAVPVEQYLDNYVVLVPHTWIIDKMTLTREPGTTITANGVDVDSWTGWSESAPITAGWEVVRIEVTDGPYTLLGNGPFGVQVVGYDDYDSYCYPGGLDQQIINDL